MLNIRILTPSQLLFEGQVESVTLPGSLGSFTVLENHAPIISSLEKGKIIVKNAADINEYAVNSGFVEVNSNQISVCIE